MKKPKAIYLIEAESFNKIYGADERDAIAKLANIHPDPVDLAHCPDVDLSDVEIVFSGWGAPKFDKVLLDRLPKLRAIFYAAGTVKNIVSEELWSRKILLTSSYVANGRPVAEYTFAQIILSLKRTWQYVFRLKENKAWERDLDVSGCYYGAKVGIVSLGAIGRMVCERLKTLDLEAYAYDPFVSDEDMLQVGAHKAALDELFATCDVVSLHAPLLENTSGMIGLSHFQSMKFGATFINTSRGAVVDEPAMIEVLTARPDLTAILDVVEPEPPVADSPLYSLPNVFLTPHIAGSMGNECRRMGRLAMEECRRFLKGEAVLHAITKENIHKLA
ncbi:hydroxyacid dehydrogenase [Cerasicoccus arenae]|uniref:Phosphoglycerate dehydrogenase n=1 Tax=Cerasicoccus arenae TaxID=424488 RepID=A0A8J3DKE0_9BACT|nr:hydroxyacid dehydrogenase [Cerasicoccus arenae]MBK1859602.1 hydroxyacid dehydrogenase [Cerasicoccus arenae]GHC03652.1 phosphoglycerate dehydrogenase [Cerasicoccus arenae]